MHKTNVLKIIQTFTEEEIRGFNDFLNSPYFNKSSGVVKLFSAIKKYYPDYASEELFKEKLWNNIYPDKKFNYGVMKNLINDLTKLSEMFIGLNNLRRNELKMFAELSEALRLRKLSTVLESKQSILLKKFGDSGVANFSGSVMDYYNILATNSIRNIDFKHTYEYGYDFSFDMQSALDQILVNLYTTIIQFATSNLFYSFTSDKINKKNEVAMLSEYISDDVIRKLIEDIKPRSEIKYIFLRCYYLAHKALSDMNDVKKFREFMNFFEERTYCMPLEMISDLHTIANNIIFLAHPKTFDKSREFYEIYLFRQSTNTLNLEDYRSSTTFMGWVGLLFEEAPADEIEKFVKSYKDYILGSDKKDIINFSNAILYFRKGEYQKTLQLLSISKFNDFNHECLAKKFILMSNFELNDYDSFLLNMDSTKHFIKYHSRDGIKDASKFKRWQAEILNIFIDDLNHLFKLKMNSDLPGLYLLRKEIEEKDVNLKKSFLRQIDKTISEIPLKGKRITA